MSRLDELSEVAGKEVSRETFDDLGRFEEMFLHWAERINLAAPSTLRSVWTRHILDSAQLLPLVPGTSSWIDLGSGGGFPGLVVAFLLRGNGGGVELVESNRRKAGFLQAVVGEFNLPARVHAIRIEDAALQPKLVLGADVITARALAPVSRLLDLTAPWLSAGARGLFHKGRDYRSELQESVNRWSFDLIEHPSRVDSQGVVLEITALRKAMV